MKEDKIERGTDDFEVDKAGRPWYALEKFEEAVYELTVGPGDACERVHSVKLIICAPAITDIPVSLKEDYEWIRSMIRSTELSPNRITCGKIAERIVTIHDGLKEFVKRNS